MQVYKLFFQVLRKQKGQIIMYLVIFLSVTLAAASQGRKDRRINIFANYV